MSTNKKKRYQAWTCRYHTLHDEARFRPGLVMSGGCSMTGAAKKSDAYCTDGCPYGGKIDWEKVNRIEAREEERARQWAQEVSEDEDQEPIDTERAVRTLARCLNSRGGVPKRAFSADPRMLDYLYLRRLVEIRVMSGQERYFITDKGKEEVQNLNQQGPTA